MGQQPSKISKLALARYQFNCNGNSFANIDGDLFTPMLHVGEDASVRVGGQLGSTARKVQVWDVKGTLTAGQVHAVNFPTIDSRGVVSIGDMRIDNATLGQRIKKRFGINPFKPGKNG